MATAYITPAPVMPAPGARWLPTAASATATMMFAALAFRLSFDALTDQATRHGVAPDTAWMFATLVDGGALVGTVGVLAARWAHRRTWPYWTTTLAFTALSLIFNIAHSDGTPIGVAIAVTPPAALVVSIELLVRLLPFPTGAAPASPLAADTETSGDEAVEGDVPPTVEVPEAPPSLADLLAAASATTTAPAATAVTPRGEAGRLPLAAVFNAPPAAPASVTDAEEGAQERAAAVPEEAVTAYRRLQAETGRRPTAEELGAALHLRRSRGGELRRLVEEELDLTEACAVTFP